MRFLNLNETSLIGGAVLVGDGNSMRGATKVELGFGFSVYAPDPSGIVLPAVPTPDMPKVWDIVYEG